MMNEGMNRQETARSARASQRVIELWRRGDMSTDRIAAVVDLSEEEVCRIIDRRDVPL
ncbi:hypothetical protein [Martelella sp. HB161492]|uniref:hypothetical protein n=1 Tax=Martelella sp. HB161492 TaxID=2720726 RepID=UPI00158FE9CC|nr:hypothetical protein [Martelella sp. HB161492]